MTLEIGLVLGVLAGAVVLFVTEKLRVDLVALLVMVVLLVAGVVTPEQGLAGFSNEATVTVAAMFVLSAGVFKTGAAAIAGQALSRIGRKSFWLALVVVMGVIGAISAFINNTAAVAIFLPVVLGLARDTGTSPGKLLMPLSFASMFGGVCTLVGTSTNVLVSAIAVRHGQPAFGMFEFAPLGLVFFGAGTLYMMLVGVRLIPDRREAADLTRKFEMDSYLTEVVLLPEALSVGRTIADSPLVTELDLDILEVRRGTTRRALAAAGAGTTPAPRPEDPGVDRVRLPAAGFVLKAGDVLRVRCDIDRLRKLEGRTGVRVRPDARLGDAELEDQEVVLIEAVVAPGASVDGATLQKLQFRQAYGGSVLAIRHRAELIHDDLDEVPLRGGDALLVKIRRDRLPLLREAFLVVSEVDWPAFRRKRMPLALGIVVAVVAVAAFGWVPIAVSAVAGAIAMVLSGCLTTEEAYQSIEGKVIFLLAGMLALGTALETSGAALLIAQAMTDVVAAWGKEYLVAAFYLLTTLLTNAMSNNATAALVAPVAIASASAAGMDARPLLIAVTFAASSSFMTPVGYQTNTLIYAPGRYHFSDFLRVGSGLNLLFFVLATWLIPKLWPL